MPKRYPIHQSPLYSLQGKKQFEKAIGVEWDSIKKLLSPNNYHVFFIEKDREKEREIQEPIKWLAHIHKRIAKLFARIELPDYIYSQKGRSYVDNAKQHIGDDELIKTDIHKFYPSTTRQMVYKMFVQDFKCAKDIAGHLADICCYQQKHLPTGSPLSGRIAFFAAKHMFDRIADLATENNCKMTAYVDDITISGKTAYKRLLGTVRQIVSQQGFKTKYKKSKTFSNTGAKTVTGTIIVGNELRLPNKRHRKIWETKQSLAKATGHEKLSIANSLKGRLQEARQIVPLK